MDIEKERLETKEDMLNFWIEELVKYFKEIGFEVDPLPQIELNGTPNPIDELFIKTGYYDPNDNKLVLFIDGRHIKDILRKNDQKVEGETKEQTEDRLEKAARSIAADRKNIGQLSDRIFADNLSKLFKEHVKPEVEKVSAKEFAERAK